MVDPDSIEYMTRNEADMAFKRRVKTIFDFVNPHGDMRILDLPCGRGFYLNMFQYVSNCELVGADLDWRVVKTARQVLGHLAKVHIHHASIYSMPYPRDCFDAVILSEIIEHIDDDIRGLKEAYRVLKPGGVLVVTVPNANYPFWWDPINKTLERLLNRHIQRGPLAGIWANHVRLYTAGELRASVEEAGFEVEEERAMTRHCFPFSHNLVYGFGKPLLESGILSKSMQSVANRHDFHTNGARLNPIKLGVALFNAFDRKNGASEPPEIATVNLALKGRKPNA
ncbi:MAG: class I SAM-dependent methyltransferase [Chloroflexi bacterium]|nr:class I SAM-dependent methyltransferase [Chloroflexota bacterium]